MRRDPATLTRRQYDLIIVGGGIFGLCAAWDAAARGLSVALLERGDFGYATSANHFKMVHGGIRYLQHLDLPRVRESSHERSALLRLAPHLVEPLPICIPTYGHGTKGKAFLRAGILAYDALTADRNRRIADPARRIPLGRALSRREALALFPALDPRGLTGAVVFSDGQIYNPPRLSLAFLRTAVESGADAANYVEATDLIVRGGRVAGVRARDRLSGAELEVQGRSVLNAAGPWAGGLLGRWLGRPPGRELTFSRDACFVVRRPLLSDTYALAIQGQTHDPDAVLSRGNRHLFVVPWRGHSLVGVWHKVFRDDPDAFTLTADEVQSFLDELNQSCPGLNLTLADVAMWNAGLVLFGENEAGSRHLSYGKRSLLIDHGREHGIEGLFSLIGVRYTTGRGMARKAVDLVAGRLGGDLARRPALPATVYGGEIEHYSAFEGQALQRYAGRLAPALVRSLTRNYGAAFEQVLRGGGPGDEATLAGSDVLRAQVRYAVREEMAQTLGDVVLRRTDLGTGGHPGVEALTEAAELMAAELGWEPGRAEREIAAVAELYPGFGALPVALSAPQLAAEPVGAL